MNELKVIDFSGGIRSKDIQDNFVIIEEQLSRERLATAGYGVSSGLDINIENFDVTITDGSLIGKNGKEAFFLNKTLKIEKPRLSEVVDKTILVEDGGQIILENIPYCLHRESVVTVSSLLSGLSIVDYNTNEKISLRSISDNTLIVDSSFSGSLVRVSYSYTNKRYDTIYIDKDKNIKSVEGTTSSSPTVMMPEDVMYVLGYIEINPFSLNSKNERVAKIKVKEDTRNVRNIFTDSNNKLFICGTPFEDLQIIHMVQPSSPHENQLWYDSFSNKLKVWKTLDGISQWLNVNDMSTIPVLESFMFLPDNCPEDRQTFIFNKDDIRLRYVPGKNSLDIRIDQGILHKDQFEEITIAKAKTDLKLKELLIIKYGYDGYFIDEVDEKYENIGIGFRLSSKLDTNCYVEALITQRIQENPLFNRFQRTATFLSTGEFTAEGFGKVFDLKNNYSFGENQIEVFHNGLRLVSGKDFLEGTESEYKYEGTNLISPKMGNSVKSFTVKINLPANSIISYKITTNVYSYDHVEKLLGEVKDKIDTAENTSKEAMGKVISLEADMKIKINGVDANIEYLNLQNQDHATFLKKTDKISEENIAQTFLEKLTSGMINKTVQKTSGTMVQVEGIKKNDFIVIFNLSGNNVIKRIQDDNPDGEGDYYMTDLETGAAIMFKNASTVQDGTYLYITGIKIG